MSLIRIFRRSVRWVFRLRRFSGVTIIALQRRACTTLYVCVRVYYCYYYYYNCYVYECVCVWVFRQKSYRENAAILLYGSERSTDRTCDNAPRREIAVNLPKQTEFLLYVSRDFAYPSLMILYDNIIIARVIIQRRDLVKWFRFTTRINIIIIIYRCMT